MNFSMQMFIVKATLHVVIVSILWTLTTGKMKDMGGDSGMEVMVMGSDGKMMG